MACGRRKECNVFSAGGNLTRDSSFQAAVGRLEGGAVVMAAGSLVMRNSGSWSGGTCSIRTFIYDGRVCTVFLFASSVPIVFLALLL